MSVPHTAGFTYHSKVGYDFGGGKWAVRWALDAGEIVTAGAELNVRTICK